MSRRVATLVYSKQVGSMARKSVLAYFADRANDDGSGIWTAKQRIADEIECSKQTVITTVKAMLSDGLIIETGKRPNGNGYTVEYAIDLVAVAALPDAKRDDQEVQFLTGEDLDGSIPFTPRGQPALPKPSLNRPIPQKATPSSGKRASKPTLVPSNFAPAVKPDSITGKAMAGWPPGYLAEQIEHFIDHHTVKGTLSHNWQASWRTWVKQGNRFNGQSRANGMAGFRQPGARTGDGLINAIRESRASREAVPWDANDPSAVPRLASMG